jgi:hypothetical protein
VLLLLLVKVAVLIMLLLALQADPALLGQGLRQQLRPTNADLAA